MKIESLERNFRQNEVLILTGPTHVDVFKKRKFSPMNRHHTHCAQKLDFARADVVAICKGAFGKNQTGRCFNLGLLPSGVENIKLFKLCMVPL